MTTLRLHPGKSAPVTKRRCPNSDTNPTPGPADGGGPALRPAHTRRRVLGILAGAACLPVFPGAAPAGAPGLGSGLPPGHVVRRWRGVALGGDASIVLALPAAQADAALAAAVAELARLEALFSLYRAESALSRLNRAGRLDDPADEVLALFDAARTLHDASSGAFDVTVAPLWHLYRDHFATSGARSSGPSPVEIARARRLVDFRAVSLSARRVAFLRPGMSVTLNGIAQGYVTDRVCAVLRDRGARHVLADLGESRALGPRPDGTPWRIGLVDPFDRSTLADTVSVTCGAVATSAGYGYRFDRDGRFHHLFDPATGLPARRYASVTVEADTATVADGLATALYALPVEKARRVVGAFGARARITLPDGSVRRLA